MTDTPKTRQEWAEAIHDALTSDGRFARVDCAPSDDERIARLTALARRVPEWARYEILVHVESRRAYVERVGHAGDPLLECGPHPRALDALEAALLVLAGGFLEERYRERINRAETRAQQLEADAAGRRGDLLALRHEIEQLAAEMEREVELGAECDAVGTAVAACTRRWAAELRARAKGSEP